MHEYQYVEYRVIFNSCEKLRAFHSSECMLYPENQSKVSLNFVLRKLNDRRFGSRILPDSKEIEGTKSVIIWFTRCLWFYAYNTHSDEWNVRNFSQELKMTLYLERVFEEVENEPLCYYKCVFSKKILQGVVCFCRYRFLINTLSF